jgi:hypothetical protein
MVVGAYFFYGSETKIKEGSLKEEKFTTDTCLRVLIF